MKGLPRQHLPLYEDVCNLVGFANGQPYWLSVDKKWVIYVSPDKKNWIIGLAENLETPISINAWMYTNISSCPENGLWETYWQPDKKAFFNTTEKGEIELKCLDKNLITLRNGEKLSNDGWLKTMTRMEMEDKVNSSSSVKDICGRRPWTNVEDYYKQYPIGNPKGFSGALPYGPDLRKARRGRIVG